MDFGKLRHEVVGDGKILEAVFLKCRRGSLDGVALVTAMTKPQRLLDSFASYRALALPPVQPADDRIDPAQPMAGQPPLREFQISCAQRLYDRAVLGVRDENISRVPPVCEVVATHGSEQFFDRAQQPSIRASGHEQGVPVSIELEQAARTPGRLTDPAVDAGQVLEILGPRHTSQPQGQAIEGREDCVGLLSVAGVQWGDGKSPADRRLEQATAFECEQGFTERAAANLDLVSQRRLADRLARCESAVEDPLSQGWHEVMSQGSSFYHLLMQPVFLSTVYNWDTLGRNLLG